MNTVYYANFLETKYRDLFLSLKKTLYKYNIDYKEIPDTNDVWCRDFMPVAAYGGELVQFVYCPKYLRNKKYANAITSPCCYRDMPFAADVKESVVILDGGSIEICGRIGIVTERVFEDNYWYDRQGLVQKLKDTLGLSTLIVIPVEPADITGHVDGVLRFVTEGHVVMNDYSAHREDVRLYGQIVEKRLREHGISNISFMPYAPTFKEGPDGFPEAIGCYINFLRVGKLIVLPQFGIPADELARDGCQRIFSDCVVESIDCRELARAGGVLNCISWEETVYE